MPLSLQFHKRDLTGDQQPGHAILAFASKEEKERFERDFNDKSWREPDAITTGLKSLKCAPVNSQAPYVHVPIAHRPPSDVTGSDGRSSADKRLDCDRKVWSWCNQYYRHPDYDHRDLADLPDPFSMWGDDTPPILYRPWLPLKPPSVVPHTARPPTQVYSR